MNRIILLSGISFLSGVALTVGVLHFMPKHEVQNESTSKVLYNTKETANYYFPTHNNLLVMDRSNAEVSEAFIVEVAPGKHTHRHVHNDAEQLFYVLSGKGRLDLERDGGKTNYNMEPTNFVHIPRNFYHQIFCAGTDSLCYLAIDCFPIGKNTDEPTWDDHVKVMCKLNGWKYSNVRTKP